MATKSRKKKSEVVNDGQWPKIVVGTHLTVTTFEDGTTVLAWDDAALEREVKEAIASVEKKKTK